MSCCSPVDVVEVCSHAQTCTGMLGICPAQNLQVQEVKGKKLKYFVQNSTRAHTNYLFYTFNN